MITGTVKWFNPVIGFGFITPDSGGIDVLVHESAVARAGFDTLMIGQKILFEVLCEEGRHSASQLKAQGGAA